MESAPTDPTSSSPLPFLLGGERVLLRPHLPGDAPRAFEMLEGEQRILSWLTWAGPSSVQELAEYYGEWRFRTQDGDDLRLAILDREKGQLVGSIALRFVGHPDVADVGYWIGAEYHKQGFGTEGLTLAACLAFRHLDARALFAWVFDGNVASTSMLERNGFVHVRSRDLELADGSRRREHHMSVVADDWSRTFADWQPRVEEINSLDGA